ncbi:hypothetical protein DdX_13674 [Ditylenchus destructor]|uniref:Uncharacterized protein n=1 Tax=Ditylenchus destructor TaxID=166010 RepID=A0AAD4MW37_9BILA|nr:hypothetical protein DdX_13674 [Ditylenchus destructor]
MEVASVPGPSRMGTSSVAAGVIERVGQLQLKIETFFKLANMGDVSTVYKGRAVWALEKPSELYSAVKSLMIEGPATRSAVLHFVSNLIHENTHLYFLTVEKVAKSSHRFDNLDRANRQILEHIEAIMVEFNKESFALEILVWLFSLLSELGVQNGKRPAMGGKNMPGILLDIFHKCPCVYRVIQLLNKCFAFLLEKAPHDAIGILVESAKSGDKSDWIWLHMANTFPSEVVGPLIDIGIAEFKAHCRELLVGHNLNKARVVQLQDEINLKLRSFSEFFTYLSDKKKNAMFKMRIRKIVEDFFESESGDSASMFFLLKIFTISPTVFLFVANELKEFLSVRSLLRLFSLAGEPTMQITIPAKQLLQNFLVQIVNNLDIRVLLTLAEYLMPVVMRNKELIKEMRSLPPTLQAEFRDESLKIMNQILNRILAISRCEDRRYFVNRLIYDVPTLESFISNKVKKRKAANSILEGDEIGNYTAKLMYIVCVLSVMDKEADRKRSEDPRKFDYILDLFSMLLANAKDEEQLANFLAFARTLTPLYSDIMTRALRHFLARIPHYTKTPNGRQSTLFVSNMLSLITWHVNASEGDELKHLGLSLIDLKGEMHVNLMDWGLGYIETVKEWSDDSVKVVDCFLTLIKTVIPKVQLGLNKNLFRLKDPNRLLVQFSAMIILLLRLINKDHFGTAFDGIDFVCRCYAVTGIFFMSQAGASKDLLISALLDEAFENSTKLFGTSKDQSRTQEEINFEPISPQNFLGGNGPDYSCLKELRSTPFGSKSAANIAHSGTISSRHKRKIANAVIGMDESESMRTLLFVNMIENLCVSDNQNKYDSRACRHLGESLTDRLSPDGLASAYTWLDWETERELTPRYLEVNRLIEDELPFVFDFLLILSGAGMRGVFSALPIFKAMLASALVQLESTPLKDGPILQQSLVRISRVFAILISASFLPSSITAIFDVISQLSNHEASVILQRFWSFLQAILPQDLQTLELDQLSDGSSAILTKEKAGLELISMVILVIQRNISVLGPHLPSIIMSSGMESGGWSDGESQAMIGEDDWS